LFAGVVLQRADRSIHLAAMAAKINAKNMDYFKFKKIVIDGSRDDYESCSRDIRSLCDAVQTLSFRFVCRVNAIRLAIRTSVCPVSSGVATGPRGCWGAGRTGRHLLGAAKGRKTPKIK